MISTPRSSTALCTEHSFDMDASDHTDRVAILKGERQNARTRSSRAQAFLLLRRTLGQARRRATVYKIADPRCMPDVHLRDMSNTDSNNSSLALAELGYIIRVVPTLPYDLRVPSGRDRKRMEFFGVSSLWKAEERLSQLESEGFSDYKMQKWDESTKEWSDYTPQ